MKSLKLAGIELRRLSGERMSRLALLVIILVPLLYGVLYLWAFWDPYSHLEELPVALVDSDREMTVDGERLTAGHDLAESLLERGTFDWDEVSAKEASEGLESGRYLMAIEIPADFSADLGTANSDEPVRAQLRVTYQESSNMLASQIGARVFAEIRSAASASASEKYVDKMFLGFADARKGLVEASLGASELAEGLERAANGAGAVAGGAGKARDGAAELTSGLQRLAAGAREAHGGAASLAAGAKTLASGLSAAKSGAGSVRSGAGELSTGATTLADGLTRLSAGASTLSSSATSLSTGASRLASGVAQAVAAVDTAADGSARLQGASANLDDSLRAYVANHPDALSDPDLAEALTMSAAVRSGSRQLADGLVAASTTGSSLDAGARQVAGGSAQLATGLQALASGLSESSSGSTRLAGGAVRLADGSNDLADGVSSAAAGSAALRDGAEKLASGADAIAAGTRDAADGSSELTAGLASLADGSNDLAAGLTPATDGSRELASGLTAGVDGLPVFTDDERLANSEMMSDPVELNERHAGRVPNYGTGFAPYFIPLSLWVGALIVYFIVRPLPRRALSSGASSRAAAFAGFWPGAAIATAQALVLAAVLDIVLGLKPVSPVAFYAFTALAALCFVAVLQFLSAAGGPAIGKLVSIVVLMLQLTSAAGTFPIQLVPGFFRALSPFLPMTYVVAGLRQAISGGDMSALVSQAAALTAFGLAALGGTLLVARRNGVWTMERLRPSFEL